MFDFWPRPERTYAELILKKMRPGDIHTHVFAQQFPILLADGKMNPILAQAPPARSYFRRRTRGWEFLVSQCCTRE